MRVEVELWMWLGELGEDFYSPSPMRSHIQVEAEEGVSVRGLIGRLARRYPLIAEKIFDWENGQFRSALTIMITHDGRIKSFPEANDVALQNGDKVTILPLYAGG
jgi:molybdopterin converting factor small subunit